MALPSGYRRLKYIQSSGNQWFNTGVAGKTGLSVFCDFEMVSTDLSDIIISGSVTSDWSKRCYPIAIQSGYFAYGYTNWYNSSTKCSANTRYAVRTDLLSSGQKMTVNGTTVQSSASTTSLNNGYNVFMFGNNVAGSGRGYGSQRVYACQMYMDGSLVRDYIPCETNSGIIGMWDDVNSVFYGNAGTGSFIAAPEFAIGEDRFPVSYRKLPFIESTGTQYINTGVIGKSGIKVKAKYASLEDAARIFLGSATSDWQTRCYPLFRNSGSSYFGYGYGGSYSSSIAAVLGTAYTVETDLSVGSQSMIVDGTTIVTSNNATAFTTGNNMTMFGVNNGNSVYEIYSYRLYFCKIYDVNTLVRDYIPCETDTGEVGLWDTVDLRFYGNAGTGAFINPLAPVGDHNTYISGVARGIDGIIVNIGGASRGVRGGTVLIGGVVREFEFEPSVFTVTVTGNYTSNYYATATMNGTRLLPGNSYEVEEGTQIVCTVKSDAVASTQRAYIYLNGVLLDPYTYTLTVSGNVTIDLSNKVTSRYSWGIITITTS